MPTGAFNICCPLCRETQSLGQQMLNAPVGINGLMVDTNNSTNIFSLPFQVLKSNFCIFFFHEVDETNTLVRNRNKIICKTNNYIIYYWMIIVQCFHAKLFILILDSFSTLYMCIVQTTRMHNALFDGMHSTMHSSMECIRQ